jgi:hypothetical protein
MSDERMLGLLALVGLVAIAVLLFLERPQAAIGDRCWLLGRYERTVGGEVVCVIREL